MTNVWDHDCMNFVIEVCMKPTHSPKVDILSPNGIECYKWCGESSSKYTQPTYLSDTIWRNIIRHQILLW